MSLRINTNVAALNSYNNLNANQAKLEASFQQLSSGLRINKAADDAAGLSIAQGLTSQINGLTQAVSNANDGINVAQIADGALGTTQDILQRMRGLIVKAGNVGTQDSKSLGAIQQEIQNLNTQLDNISSQTKFGQTNLLDGTYNKNFQVGANGGDTIALDLSSANVQSGKVGGVNLNTLNIAAGVKPFQDSTFAIDTTKTTLDAFLSAGVAANETAITSALGSTAGTAVTVKAGDTPNTWNLSVTSSGAAYGQVSFNSDTDVYTFTNADGKITSRVDAATHGAAPADNFTDGTTTGATATAFETFLNGGAAPAASVSTFSFTTNPAGGWNVSYDADGAGAGAAVAKGTLTFTDGVYKLDNSGTITYFNPSTESPSSGISDYSSSQATKDLANIDTAIDGISAARSQIGAVQNQLGYTVSNLQTAITNVTASRSNLTDADLAQQVTAMTQSQILTQAATSVLAQANSAPQAILKLLQ